MCGICGKYSPSGVQEAELRRMMQAIGHRGPDDEGIYINRTIGLCNRRLSIIDIDGGHQPICNEDGSIWVVCNGEIYNYKALRRRLGKAGHVFSTHSDTEVVAHLYEEHGVHCADYLDGMFAFAIWDDSEKLLFLARDRLGQKPLFYSENNGRFIFASEVKAILAADGQDREIDYESIHHYLSLRFIPSPKTMFRSIKKLPPAHTLVRRNGSTSLSRYWNLSFRKKLDLSEVHHLELLDRTLNDTIESHLISDVPVGAFLSGGMDSSLIVALMARKSKTAFKTFTIGVDERSFNELPYARIVADRYKTNHYEEKVCADLIQLLPKIIWHLDEPSDSIASCQFYAASLAARHVKVVLGGDGGDELFGGFDRYTGVRYIDYLMWMPECFRRGIVGALLNRFPEGYHYKSLTQKARWIHEMSLLPNMAERYAEATCVFRFNHQKKQQLYSSNFWRKMADLKSANIITDPFESDQADDVFDRMLYADIMTRLPEHSLMLADRMTMAHGLEVRSPFVDHHLVELLAAFPSRLKMRGLTLKYGLRKVAGKYLSKKIVKRKKQGFMFPVAFWFRNELYPFIRSVLLNSFFVKQGFFKSDYLLKLIDDHYHNRIDNHARIWMLLSLEIWQQLYIEQKGVSDVTQYILENCRTNRSING
ncbi:MAG: asparagine synthase (glutamine-hydrolyzing) [Desulfobacterales bacterium]